MPPRRLALLLLCTPACGTSGASDTGTATDPTTGDPGTSASPTTGTTATTGPAGSTAEPTTTTPTTGDDDPCNDTPQALADCVDAAAYTAELTFIADVRTPGSPHWLAVQDRCADRLDELGYEVALQNYGTGVNVVGRRVGLTAPAEIVLIGAHYDHVADCHGADDNASGVAATLEIARVLAQAEFDRTVMIACWDEEELGLVGSEAFVAAAKANSDDIVIDFNFDMIGVRSDEEGSQKIPAGFDFAFPDAYAAIQANGSRGDFIAVITSSLAHDHALAYAAAADRVALRNAVLELPAGSETSDLFGDLRRSDHASFWDAGYPAVFLSDTGEFRNDHYHCMGGPDEVADLDLDFAVKVTRATVEASAVALGLTH